MFNNIESKNITNVTNEIPFVDKYPMIKIYVEKVEISDIGEDLCWLRHTHKSVNINNGEFIGVIHNGLSGLLKNGNVYIIYFDRPDKRFDRYVEILNVNKVDVI